MSSNPIYKEDYGGKQQKMWWAVWLLLYAGIHAKGTSERLLCQHDGLGWFERQSWFRDTSVDSKRCSRVVASAGRSMSQFSKVCWPSPHFGHVGSTKGSMMCRYASIADCSWPLRLSVCSLLAQGNQNGVGCDVVY